MDEYKVVLSKTSVADMEKIFAYIRDILGVVEYAVNQIYRLEKSINTLRLFPERIKIRENEYCRKHSIRILLVNNYSVLYTIKDDTVYIVRVLYSSMDIGNML